MKYVKVHSTDFFNQHNYDAIIERIQSLSPNDNPLWGTMNAGQMLQHLNKAIGGGLGFFQFEDRSNLITRTIVKYVVLDVMKSFLKGTSTPKVLEATNPDSFDKEKAQLIDILTKGYQTTSDNEWQHHPYFGVMTRDEWGKLIMIHVHHHLQQFNR